MMMMMMTTGLADWLDRRRDADHRVRVGVALLDDRVPGWRDRVRVDRLNVDDEECCPLAQAIGLAFSDAVDRLNLPRRELVACGMLARERPNSLVSSAVTSWNVVREYRALTDAWHRYLTTTDDRALEPAT